MGDIGQVSDGVPQMDQATQQNPGLVEQAASAAAARRTEAARLKALMAVFRIADGASGLRTHPRTGAQPGRSLLRAA